MRGWIWKILLRLCDSVSASCYIKLVERGPSPMDTKIRNDTFRTMTTDASFIEHVSEDMLIRVLNAFVWISQQGLSYKLKKRRSKEGKRNIIIFFLYICNI